MPVQKPLGGEQSAGGELGDILRCAQAVAGLGEGQAAGDVGRNRLEQRLTVELAVRVQKVAALAE